MKRLFPSWRAILMFMSLVFGIAGGGVMGGAAGYYEASRQQATTATVASGKAAAAPAVTQQTALSSAGVAVGSPLIDAVQKAEPAVVTIINTMQVQSRRGGSGTAVAEGSGVIIDAQGHIVTNAHVVEGAQTLQVILHDGSKVSATLIGADSANDIAVVQVSGNVPATLTFGDSSALQLGEPVIAIGSPLGSYDGSVTAGVVSGLERTVQGSGQSHLIQTDAAINSGNSGGPLLNAAGEVIGINTLVVRQSNSGDIAEGLGFAIPSDMVTGVVQQLIGQAL
jgi:2-alkenal reductase